jgi:PIN domain nuclease of toxin-antitoxin system
MSLEISQNVNDYANEINGDPADRIIAARTLSMDAVLLTRDKNLIAASFPKTL